MIHSREEQELAKAQAAVVQAQTKVDKLRVKMMKKVLQYLKTAMGEWTDDHHDHFEQMALVCHEIRR